MVVGPGQRERSPDADAASEPGWQRGRRGSGLGSPRAPAPGLWPALSPWRRRRAQAPFGFHLIPQVWQRREVIGELRSKP